jgi:hypothetical protein
MDRIRRYRAICVYLSCGNGERGRGRFCGECLVKSSIKDEKLLSNCKCSRTMTASPEQRVWTISATSLLCSSGLYRESDRHINEIMFLEAQIKILIQPIRMTNGVDSISESRIRLRGKPSVTGRDVGIYREGLAKREPKLSASSATSVS